MWGCSNGNPSQSIGDWCGIGGDCCHLCGDGKAGETMKDFYVYVVGDSHLGAPQLVKYSHAETLKDAVTEAREQYGNNLLRVVEVGDPGFRGEVYKRTPTDEPERLRGGYAAPQGHVNLLGVIVMALIMIGMCLIIYAAIDATITPQIAGTVATLEAVP